MLEVEERRVRTEKAPDSRRRAAYLGVPAVVVAFVVALATAGGGTSLNAGDVAELRAKGLVAHHERLWDQATESAARAADANARYGPAMSDHHERLWLESEAAR